MERTVLGQPTGTSYSLGMVVPEGRLVFISGTVATDDDGRIVGSGDMEAQARKVFERIGRLLEQGGASFKEVVKLTTFLTDIGQYEKFARVRTEVFGDGPYPASSTVEVSGLVDERLLLEVEVIAVV